MRKKKIGEVLAERGKISLPDLARAIEEQRGKVFRLGELILKRGLANKAEIASALEEVIHIPYVDCAELQPDAEALKLIPPAVARRCCALPLRREGGRLVVAMAEPQNLPLLDALRFTSGFEISPRLGFHEEIEAAILAHYSDVEAPGAAEPSRGDGSTEAADSTPELQFISVSARQANREAIEEVQAELRQKRTPAVRLVSTMLLAAMGKNASDVHIEPQANEVVVRIRVDGVLRDLQTVPRALQNSLVSRIKIISDLDIAERRSPQDGRFLVQMRDREVDVRVSTLPTQFGEKVVMRLLQSAAPQENFADIGMNHQLQATLTSLLSRPQGMLLVTGPTGSGKSTTLYAALNLLRRPAVNIVTVEDPIEYALPGTNQVQVNTKAGLTFASCLRSILRQDPNVIMVGEVRDRETAEIAMKSAQTGHMVLSTLHTNDSVSAVTRLLDLGIPGFLVASSVTAILAQRLVRRLCVCHEESPPTEEAIATYIGMGMSTPPARHNLAVGCAECDHTGYKGRIAVFELLVFDDAIRNAVRATPKPEEIRHLARLGGTKTMLEDALERVRQGVTTLEEIRRVVPVEAVTAIECGACQRSLVPAFKYCPYCGTLRNPPSRRSGAHRKEVPQAVLS